MKALWLVLTIIVTIWLFSDDIAIWVKAGNRKLSEKPVEAERPRQPLPYTGSDQWKVSPGFEFQTANARLKELSLHYESSEALIEKERKEGQRMAYSEAEIARNVSYVPEGGRLVIYPAENFSDLIVLQQGGSARSRDKPYAGGLAASIPKFNDCVQLRLVDQSGGSSIDFWLMKSQPKRWAEARGAEVTAAQATAVKKYPALGVQGSPMHREFMARYAALQAAGSEKLSRADWPLIVADEAAAAVAAKQ
jgi:hypothetical protein